MAGAKNHDYHILPPDVAVEADHHRFAGDCPDRRRLLCGRALGGAAEPGRLAEQAVKRDRSIAQPEHRRRECQRILRDTPVARLDRANRADHQGCAPIRTKVMA